MNEYSPSKETISKKDDLMFHLLFGPCSDTKFKLFLNKEENEIKCLPVFRQK